MDLINLIERIRKEHVHIQNERKSLHQLNVDVNNEIDSTLMSMWIIKNQQYICDKLHVSHQLNNDPISLINQSNKIQQADFVMGPQKFGSNEVFLTEMLQHLRDNPKSISYLLFFAEKECTNFLDLLCKIIISTIYNHCFLDQDKLSLIDMMEELVEIYINFHDDLRLHLHSKNSSFGIVYRYFCDELSELKTFYKLALIKPIMLVLSEDSLFLDIDSNRAVMRFCQEERQKHFGSENSSKYKENLDKYRKWTIQKLKYFVDNFIKSLKENIYAFPQSLVSLMIRMYVKLIERFEYQKVNAIFVDMIFFFLLCPAIQNPDLLGITDLHINHIAQYNLMQCAQIMQMLALTNSERINVPYQEVCSLFDRNCLSFIIEHIFSVAKNTIPKMTSIELVQLPHFLISEIELKFLLEYINLFLTRNDQPDQPLNTYFCRLPPSILNFELETTKQQKIKEQGGRNLKTKSTNYLCNLDEFSNLNIKHLLANNGDNWPTLKVLFNSKQIFKISNNDFQIQFIGLKSEEKLLNKIKDKHIVLDETVDKILEEIDELFGLEINNTNSSISKVVKQCVTITYDNEKAENNLASLSCLNNEVSSGDNNKNEDAYDISNPIKKSTYDKTGQDEDLQNYSFAVNINEKQSTTITTESIVDETFAELNMQSLGTLTLHLGDLTDDHTFVDENHPRNCPEITKSYDESISSNQMSIYKSINPMGNKVISSFKNIKDKMKNISLKDNRLRINMNEIKTIEDNPNPQQTDINTTKPDNSKTNFETVKAETDEIFGKYRSTTKIQNSTENVSSNSISQNLISLDDGLSSLNGDSNEVDLLCDFRNKLRKLVCLIDICYVYRQYKFLNLSNKNDFMMLLKILLSQSNDIKEMSTSVLIMDILRIIQGLTQEEFIDIFKQIETDWKTRNFYIIYLLKSKQYLLHKLQLLQSVQQQLKKEHSSTNFIIISFLVRLILEKQEPNIQALIDKFRDSSTLTDEKASLVKTLLNETINQLQIQFLTDEQFTLVQQILERYLMNRIYLYAFYPNGDIDHMRDQILHQQINQLSSNITHNSKLLNIPSKYFTTNPWPSAQAELLLLSAYKTPRDKVQCVYRCCSHIITLLSTCQNSIPSADDLLPVLIYVVIKSNAKSILSTIQYVNTFYLNDMTGEESYYWTQYCSAVEFIKTILNEQQHS